MWPVYGGAIMVIAGIAAFVEAHGHHPEAHDARGLHLSGHEMILGRLTLTGPTSGWSQTAYDLVRIGAWALLLVGGLLILTGLIRYWTGMRSAP